MYYTAVCSSMCQRVRYSVLQYVLQCVLQCALQCVSQSVGASVTHVWLPVSHTGNIVLGKDGKAKCVAQ